MRSTPRRPRPSGRGCVEERDELPEFDFGPLPSIEELGEQIAEQRRTFDARLAGRSAGA